MFCAGRIAFAHLLRAQGAPWPLAHDAIDYGIRAVAMLVVIHLWLDAAARAAQGRETEAVLADAP